MEMDRAQAAVVLTSTGVMALTAGWLREQIVLASICYLVGMLAAVWRAQIILLTGQCNSPEQQTSAKAVQHTMVKDTVAEVPSTYERVSDVHRTACWQHEAALQAAAEAKVRGDAMKANILQSTFQLRQLVEAGDEHPDALLGRFVAAHGCDHHKAARQWRDYVEWRERESLDAVLREPPLEPALEEALQAGYNPRLLEGWDLKGRPVLLSRVGAFDFPALRRQGVTMQMVVRRHIQTMERISLAVNASPCPYDGHLLLLDLDGSSLTLFLKSWRVWQEIISIGNLYYPNLLGGVCIVRGPPSGRRAIGMIKTLLDGETSAKLNYSVGDAWPVLRELFGDPPTANLPADLGPRRATAPRSTWARDSALTVTEDESIGNEMPGDALTVTEHRSMGNEMPGDAVIPERSSPSGTSSVEAAESVEAAFATAVDAARALRGLDNEVRLELYAFYKQATSGDASESCTAGRMDVAGRMKWKRWSAIRGMEQKQAMRQYTACVQSAQK